MRTWLRPGLGVKRWVFLVLAGAMAAGLGLAYLLADLYRGYAFPPIVWYLTLQFVDRTVRGVVFVLVGAGATMLGITRLNQSIQAALRPLAGDRSLAEMVYHHRLSGSARKVAIVGSGGGVAVVLKAVRHLPAPVSPVVIMGINDHVGLESALRTEARSLGGDAFPPATEDLVPCVRLSDGRLLVGEDQISRGRPGETVAEVFAGLRQPQSKVWEDGGGSRTPLRGNPEPPLPALQALEDADLVLFGPGSLLTNLAPTAGLKGIATAIRQNEAKKVFICNLMSEPGLTGEFSVSAYVRALQDYTGLQMDYVICNQGAIASRALDSYAGAGSRPVRFESATGAGESLLSFEDTAEQTVLVEGAILLERDLVAQTREEVTFWQDNQQVRRTLLVVRHDPEKLASALAELLS